MQSELEASRRPTAREIDVVEFLLSALFEDVEVLRAQVRGTRVSTNCVCGCESFNVYVSEGSEPSDAVSGPPMAFDEARAISMEFVMSGGFVAAVEITYYSGKSTGIPRIDGFAFENRPTSMGTDEAPAQT